MAELDLKEKDDAYWREKLTPERYRILREKGTEEPFTGEFNDNKEDGMMSQPFLVQLRLTK